MIIEDFRFWVPLISASIKAGAFEQATRRIAQANGTMQKLLLKLIPDRIRKTRIQHLEYSREKMLKYACPPACRIPGADSLTRSLSRRMSQSSSDHKDFLYYLLKQADSGAINKDEVIVNGALFM